MTRTRKSILGLLVLPFTALKTYLVGAYKELKHVTWPTREALVQYTLLTIVTIIVSVLVLTVFDYGLQQLTNRFLIR